MIDITRNDGVTHDIFDVDPSGTGWHTVIKVGVTGKAGHILYNDKLPGSWTQFLGAEWFGNNQTLYAYGRGVGGTTLYVVWEGGAWSKNPVQQP